MIVGESADRSAASAYSRGDEGHKNIWIASDESTDRTRLALQEDLSRRDAEVGSTSLHGPAPMKGTESASIRLLAKSTLTSSASLLSAFDSCWEAGNSTSINPPGLGPLLMAA
eukprot:CAMPEP_0182464748 /NCGR_PEP_ID=MMETSP1319-20130603/8810_1 /TAXON_ID=172717 /ORGANISM="Bolidomonas pacifica, Strain RCC208" /LENGTH=112 /DNA_ID=CAMNT_0024664407 /DNA_START=214 /DNA_END=552 /DNA_ORIENTATION=+